MNYTIQVFYDHPDAEKTDGTKKVKRIKSVINTEGNDIEQAYDNARRVLSQSSLKNMKLGACILGHTDGIF